MSDQKLHPGGTVRRALRHAASVGLVLTTALTGLVALPATSAYAAVVCEPEEWKVSFFAGTTFSGGAQAVTCDTAIDEDYGVGHPAGTSLPDDDFGVRWKKTHDFGPGGEYRFSVRARDGVRVFIDGVRQVNLWRDVSTEQKASFEVSVPSGQHTVRVDFAAFTGEADVSFDWVEVDPGPAPEPDVTPPAVPAGPTPTGDYYGVALDWTPNTDDTVSYNVYRWEESGLEKLGSTVEPHYKDTDLDPAERRAYAIAAVDAAGNESAPTNTVLGQRERTISSPPGQPEDLRGNIIGDRLTLSWQIYGQDNFEYVHHFEVWRSRTTPVRESTGAVMVGDTGTVNQLIATVTEDEHDYYYMVTGVTAEGVSSRFSESFMPKAVIPTAPAVPEIPEVVNGDQYVELTWTWMSSGQDESPIAGYNVYRSTSPDFTKETAVKVTASPLDGVQLKDSDLLNDHFYYYAVTSVNVAGLESELSDVATARPAAQ